MSKWFVGSSSNNNAGWMKSARANATRMRQPPEKSFVFCCCRSTVKPRPVRISVARASAVDASSSSRRSYNPVRRSVRSVWASSSNDSSPIASFSSSISFSTAARSASTFITAKSAVSSVGGYSVVKW
mmetsp:Transcript_2495/g.7202  ORF Transcript_2495/g.7202 Transcript_2495/m.7202 type:complete len:128 (-) Transcript_2495:567-950(-)